ncbi:MAG TPA: DNA-processing protein DprA [Dehalococcoidia bacterium]|nr:DNA-processing protein DprA [Dehalococcoidia bacterium]HLB29381.1 DNA-processing protein DprA [Dehalococcoidia bacterium]
MESELQYWVAFNRIPGLGPVRINLLMRYFGSLAEAWNASSGALRAAGLDNRTVHSILESRPSISPEEEINKLERHHIQALTINDPAYPRPLKEIDHPPPVLYVRGQLLPRDEWAVTVVGTRGATPYGRQVAHDFAWGLAKNGITIISGLARGIDAVAHQAALEAGGRTVAVQACGLDMVYPPENKALAQRILGQGALLSEYPLGTTPRADYFPRRNRIMSGLALGTLVVEAGERSGALITARLALDQNREVFAAPGNIYQERSQGTNRLIREGLAKLVLSIEDILAELNLTQVTQQLSMTELLPTDPVEEAVLKSLAQGPCHIDEVRRGSGLPVNQVASALALLELRGLVHQVGPMTFARAREAAGHYA